MEEKKINLCAQIPASLHGQLRQRQEESGQTLGQYMTWLITKFYESEGKSTMKENVVLDSKFEKFIEESSAV